MPDTLSARVRKLVEGLAEQQAMPSDYYKPELEAVEALLVAWPLEPLVWVRHGRYRFAAETVVGVYRVEEVLGSAKWRWELEHVWIADEESATPEEAQAAAMAFHRRRVGKLLQGDLP